MDVSTTETIAQQLRRCNDRFAATFLKQDSAGLAALYTTDGVLLPPGMSEMKGTEAIQQFWQGAMQMGVAKAELTTVEAEEYGDTAIEQGHFVLSGADGSQLDHGKYIVIWKRQGDQWYLQRDIWNTSRPA